MNMLETISKNPNVNNHNLSTFRIIKQIPRARKMLFYTTLKRWHIDWSSWEYSLTSVKHAVSLIAITKVA